MVDMGPTSGLPFQAFSEAMMGTRSATQVGGVGIRSSRLQSDGVRSCTWGGGLGGLGPRLLGLRMVGDVLSTVV